MTSCQVLSGSWLVIRVEPESRRDYSSLRFIWTTHIEARVRAAGARQRVSIQVKPKLL
jgi:hypothetical protein